MEKLKMSRRRAEWGRDLDLRRTAWANLNAIDSSKWPFAMVFDRLITKISSFFLPSKHAVVPAIGLAVPLFPA